MAELIQAKVLKGFRDFLPEQEITRALLSEQLTQTFRSFGFVPIDTPVLEYAEILLRKSEGETEKQVFRFQDNGGRDVAMRFDLTVPFARFVAEHKDKLALPFKRYHIAKVWRGEKPQAGRYREFVQCDFDIVGSDSAAVDFEIINMMRASLASIGVHDITVRVSHRGIFNRFLARLNMSDKSEDILRVVDKLAKVGEDEVRAQLTELGGNAAADEILRYIQGAGDRPEDFLKTLAHVEKLAGGPDADTKRMADVHAYLESAGISSSYIFDPSITRGLDYYTGIVFETFLNELPSIGSVCSGGRYDNLAGLYMKECIPGVGSSIGLDRLIAGLEALNALELRSSFTDLVIFCQKEEDMVMYQKIAQELRGSTTDRAGLNVEVFPEAKKMGQQYAWAEKKGIQWGLTLKTEAGDADNTGRKAIFELKNLKTRETYQPSSVEEIISRIVLI